MADRNAPVGANLARLLEYLTTPGQVPPEAPPGTVIPGQRRTEDRAAMAAEAAARFDEEERRLEERRARMAAEAQYRADRQAWREGQSAVTNRPVDAARATVPAPTEPRMGAAGRVFPGEEQPLAERQMPTPPRQAPRPRGRARGMSEADRLNEISLAFARGERPRGGAADTIGRAMGIEGYKKGGLVGAKKPVKRAMGGSIPKPPAPPKPKVPGRKAGRPATAVKVPSRKAPAAPKMPAFKKGGKVSMKGKRK